MGSSSTKEKILHLKLPWGIGFCPQSPAGEDHGSRRDESQKYVLVIFLSSPYNAFKPKLASASDNGMLLPGMTLAT